MVFTVVASSGSKSSKNEDLGFVKPLWRAAVASGGSKLGVVQGQRDLYQTENPQEDEMSCSASVDLFLPPVNVFSFLHMCFTSAVLPRECLHWCSSSGGGMGVKIPREFLQ